MLFLSFFDLSVQDNFPQALAVNVFRGIVFKLYFLISCAILVEIAKCAEMLVFSCVFTLQNIVALFFNGSKPSQLLRIAESPDSKLLTFTCSSSFSAALPCERNNWILPKRKTGGIPEESRLLCFSVVYHRVRRSCSSSVKGPGSASVPRWSPK